MPIIWCSISGHGFGHSAQLVPVVNELGRRIPNSRVILRTTVPSDFFHDTLQTSWEYSFMQQDIGCVQEGPLHIDVPQTWDAYEQFQANWDQRVEEEVQAIQRMKPDLVLSNISHLGIASGVEAGCSTVAFGSLSWDQVLAEFVDPRCSKHRVIIDAIRREYQRAKTMIRCFPGIPMEAFSEIYDVGPMAPPPLSFSMDVRRALRVNEHDRLVLVAFGGIPLSSFPLAQLEQIKGYQFIMSGSQDYREYTRIVSSQSLGVPFRQILAEADIVVTKPGYATVVEAVQLNIPLVYVRRYNFVDEQCLVDFAHQYGRATELGLEEFHAGHWESALAAVQSLPNPEAVVPASGIGEAADVIERFLE